jgi:hypothetical protein
VAVLDPAATQLVARAVDASGRDRGIRLRATREAGDDGMRTVRVEEVEQ